MARPHARTVPSSRSATANVSPAATATTKDDVESAQANTNEHGSDDGTTEAADGITASGLLCLLPSHVVVLLCVLDCLLAVGLAADLFLTLSALTRAQPSIGFGSLALVSGHYR
jgi:hypothetical protein